ncbi:hypothetical protein HYX00_02065 [Candidatus Woesearchaeota archaeon]|nr:hypothetical protein [Candidatus Woesearchaeota archaeon]
MIDTTFLDQLTRFNLVINKRVTSNLAGPRKSIATGRGLTFKDYRIYAPGDDIRLASMGFGKPFSKFDYASMIGVGFAYLALRDNEKFQFSTFADSLEIFQPRRGMSHLAAMVQHLNSIKPKGYSKLLDTIRQYKKVIGSKSMLVIASDFLVNIDEIREAFYLLGDHDIKIIQVFDRVEKELKMEGDMKLIDSETKGLLRTFISPRLRMGYQQQLDEHCAKIEEVCNKLNVDYHLAITDTSIFDTFYKILES